MLPLAPLFAQLCRDPSDARPLARLHRLCDRNAPELRPYYEQDDATCRGALTALFARPSNPLRRLVPLAEAQVRVRHRLGEDRPIDAPLLAALAADPLCLLLLSETLNTHVELERVYTGLRRACLHGRPLVSARPLMAALAVQAWINEYVWEETPEETARVAALPGAIGAAIADGDLSEATLPLLRWAMYRPLAALAVAEGLAKRPLSDVPPVLRPLWERTLRAPREEAALRAALPTFGHVTDATSRAVQARHEASPYPRWLRLAGTPRSVLECNRAYDPAFAWPATFRGPLQILVAGCGTGHHPLSLAAANPGAEVLALDLSAAALAYAQRMARELGIDNVRFLQADLLHLPAWGRQFHHIECVGVLQNLGDQEAAWQALAAVLRPGGTLRVGVPGKLACLPLTHLRGRVARDGVAPTPAAVRAYRAELLRKPEATALLGPVAGLDDLFSASMVHHLFFPAHGHQYTLAELERCAAACGLCLLGYRLPRQVRRRVAPPAGPATFARWRELEMAYTGSLGMFLCTLYLPMNSHVADER